MKENRKARILAFYLPQYHPIPENDEWWGKGFTEWTNVGKAKPLFHGHDQPKVPADLGYYDLRLEESRVAQAELAKEYGIEGFCYWHYWFGNNRRLLEKPFNEVLNSGKPDFPFCLAWANHTWRDKQFSKEGSERILIEQVYPGKEDYKNHFYTLLPAFKDKRYICIDGKPLFMIYDPFDIPDISFFISFWQSLAMENGLNGIFFVGHTYDAKKIDYLKQLGFNGVNVVRLFDFFKHDYSIPQKIYMKIMKILFKTGRVIEYKKAAKYFTGLEDKDEYCFPTIIPNWDHSPRSGRQGHILINSTPELFENHIKSVFHNIQHKETEHQIVFLKSWNEWAEGNYIEPDLKFGREYLKKLLKVLNGD